MKTRLNIIMVENNAEDRANAMREIDREFPNCRFRPVSSRRDFSHEMEVGGWDLVLTDYKLDWSDGISVVNTAKSRRPDCPVIIFTRDGNEQIAVEAMKAGADDYVLKSTLGDSRFPSALHLAMERAQLRRQKDLVERRYGTFFDNASIGLFRATGGGQIIEANPAMLNILRCPGRDILLGTNLFGVLASAGKRRELQMLLLSSGEARGFRAEACCCDGKTSWVELSVRAVHAGSDASEFYYEGSLEDINARVLTEQQLRETREQLRAMAEGILSGTDIPGSTHDTEWKYPLSTRIGARLIVQEN